MEDLYLLAGTVVVAVIIFIVIRLAYNKKKPSGATQNKTHISTVSSIKDTKDLIRDVDDIIDGIIITDDYTRFISAISCRGINLYEKSSVEQLRVVEGYQTFIASIDSPITYRAYSKSVDITGTEQRYMEKYNEILNELNLSIEYRDVAAKNKNYEDVELYNQMIESYQFKLQHLQIQLDAMRYYSNADVIRDVTQSYIFDWTYRSSDYATGHKKNERLALAKEELRRIANAKISALAASGVKAHVCTQGEVLDMFRRLSLPIASEQFSVRNIDDSSYYDDIVTSATRDILKSDIAANQKADIRDFTDQTIQKESEVILHE